MKSPRPVRRHFSIETLESRTVLAGSVAASVSEGLLTITGDNSNNSLAIYAGDVAGEVILAGATEDGTAANHTLVNGQVEPVTLEGVTGIRLDLQGGDDTVVATNLNLAGDLTALEGSGNDRLFLFGNTPGAPLIDLNGEGALQYGAVRVGGLVDVQGGAGNDLLRVVNAEVGGSLSYAGEAGNDRFVAGGNLSRNSIGGSLTLAMGQGDDSIFSIGQKVAGDVIVDDSLATTRGHVEFRNLRAGGDVTVTASPVNDVVALEGATIHADDVVINTGGGDDQVLVGLAALNSLSVETGTGDDTAIVRNLTVDTLIRVNTGADEDIVAVVSVVTDQLRVATGSGKDRIIVQFSDLNAIDAFFSTGYNDDVVDISHSTFSNLRVNAGDGADTLRLEGVTASQLFEYDGGPGVDAFYYSGQNQLSNKDVNNVDDDYDRDEDAADFDGGDTDGDGDED